MILVHYDPATDAATRTVWTSRRPSWPAAPSQPAWISAKFYVTLSLGGLLRAIGSVAQHISGSTTLCPSMKNKLLVSRKSNLCPVSVKSLCSILLQDHRLVYWTGQINSVLCYILQSNMNLAYGTVFLPVVFRLIFQSKNIEYMCI